MVAWCLEYGREFGEIIQTAAARSCSISLIHPFDLSETLDRTRNGTLSFYLVRDRASDEEGRFLSLTQDPHRKSAASTRVINLHESMRKGSDRVPEYLEFMTCGIHAPFRSLRALRQGQLSLSTTSTSSLNEPIKYLSCKYLILTDRFDTLALV